MKTLGAPPNLRPSNDLNKRDQDNLRLFLETGSLFNGDEKFGNNGTSLGESTIRSVAGIAEDERGLRAALFGGVDGVLYPPVMR